MVSEFVGPSTILGGVLTGDHGKDGALSNAIARHFFAMILADDTDLTGLCQDNILVGHDQNGKPDPSRLYFVDRGASLGLRANGQRKLTNFKASSWLRKSLSV